MTKYSYAGLTYNGHALACAAALATIEAYEEDKIFENAKKVGKYLGERLEELKAKHPSVGDVRYIGMFSALELVKNRETKEPMDLTPLKNFLIRQWRLCFQFQEYSVCCPAAGDHRRAIDEGLNLIDEGLGRIDGSSRVNVNSTLNFERIWRIMEILNYINGEWVKPDVKEYFDVINPATGEVIAKTPLCGKDGCGCRGEGCQRCLPCLAADACPGPCAISVQTARPAAEQLAMRSPALITNECGKTFEEAKAEMVRAYRECGSGLRHAA